LPPIFSTFFEIGLHSYLNADLVLYKNRNIHCPILDRGEIGAYDTDIRDRNDLETHKTLSDLKKDKKKRRKWDFRSQKIKDVRSHIG